MGGDDINSMRKTVFLNLANVEIEDIPYRIYAHNPAIGPIHSYLIVF